MWHKRQTTGVRKAFFGSHPRFLAVVIALLALFQGGCSPAKPRSEAPPQVPISKPEPPKAAKQPVLAPLPSMNTRTIVLTYHDMVPKRDKSALWFDCTPDELRSQIAWLYEQGAVFVSLTDIKNAIEGKGSLPEGAVALCFADNYLGFLTHAWPILKEEDIPVTVFVHTDHVGSQKGRPKMTWDQLRTLEATGLVHAESQTVSHPLDLTKLSPVQLEREMVVSKESLEEQLDRDITMIAYPNGKYDESVARAAQTAGYELGFTEAQMPVEKAPNRLMIPRYVHTKYQEAWKMARSAAP